MASRQQRLLLNVQLGMTIFFFFGAVISFLFLRDQPSWMAQNLWWISLLVAFADFAAFVIMANRFKQSADD